MVRNKKKIELDGVHWGGKYMSLADAYLWGEKTHKKRHSGIKGHTTVLPLYKIVRDNFLKINGRTLNIKIELTPKFLKTCEERIIAGARKYGDDWKFKNNIKERQAETYDYFNYSVLNICQKMYLSRF